MLHNQNPIDCNNSIIDVCMEIATYLDRKSLAYYLSTNHYYYDVVNINIRFQLHWKAQQINLGPENDLIFKNTDKIVAANALKSGLQLRTTTYLNLISRLNKLSDYSDLFEKQKIFQEKIKNENLDCNCYGFCLPLGLAYLGMAVGGIGTGLLAHDFAWGVLGGIGGAIVLGVAPYTVYSIRYSCAKSNKLSAEKEVSSFLKLQMSEQSPAVTLDETELLIVTPQKPTLTLSRIFSCFAKQPVPDQQKLSHLLQVTIEEPKGHELSDRTNHIQF